MRYTHQHDSLAGLEEDRRGRLPKGRRQWTGSLGQRARASRGLPQAVVKISSYSHSAGAVWDRVNYVGRDGELEVETPTGEQLTQAELEERVEGWRTETGARRREQLSMSAVVSFPKGVDEEKATEAARQFFLEAFADNHDYVFAGHTDANNFHVHVVVQSAGHDGKQLRIRRDELQDLRMLYAEKAAEQGIELDASPRWARGLEAERQKGLGIEGIERRGETPALRGTGQEAEIWSPERELSGGRRLSPDRRTQLEALVAVRRDRDPEARGVTPLEYARAAERVAGTIGGWRITREKVETIKAAVSLAQLGWQLIVLLRSRDKSTKTGSRGGAGNYRPVDTSINSHIRGLGAGWAQQEAIKPPGVGSNQLSDYRREQGNRPARKRRPARKATARSWGQRGQRPEAPADCRRSSPCICALGGRGGRADPQTRDRPGPGGSGEGGGLARPVRVGIGREGRGAEAEQEQTRGSSTGRNGRCGLRLTGSKTPRRSGKPSRPGRASTLTACRNTGRRSARRSGS